MPLYEYRCEGCGHRFEELVLRGEGPVQCPVCHGSLEKLFSPFTYQAADEACSRLPRGEARELCTECKQGGGACPFSA